MSFQNQPGWHSLYPMEVPTGEVEVVIPHSAQILVDTTALTVLDSPQPDGARKRPSNRAVWMNQRKRHDPVYERRGDRIIADIGTYILMPRDKS